MELLKLLEKTLRRESHLEEKNLIITPDEIQLLTKMRYKAKSIKSCNNITGINAKSISVRVRKLLKGMLKLEPNYAQQLIEIEKFRKNVFFFPALEIKYKVMLTCSRYSTKFRIFCRHTVSFFFAGCYNFFSMFRCD